MGKRLQRKGYDGPVSVLRLESLDDTIRVIVEHKGKEHAVDMSQWNARRVLALLAVVLEMPLSKAAAKEIEL